MFILVVVVIMIDPLGEPFSTVERFHMARFAAAVDNALELRQVHAISSRRAVFS